MKRRINSLFIQAAILPIYSYNKFIFIYSKNKDDGIDLFFFLVAINIIILLDVTNTFYNYFP